MEDSTPTPTIHLPLLTVWARTSLLGPRESSHNPKFSLKDPLSFSSQKEMLVSILFLLPKAVKLVCHTFVGAGKKI